MAETAQNWIIGMSGSEWDSVDTYRVYGTKSQVKKHLAALVREARNNDFSDKFDCGSTSMKDIKEESNGVLYAFVNYRNSHEDYTATPEMEVIKL